MKSVKTKILILFALIMMMVAPSVALAQVQANTLHLSVMPGGIFPDSQLNVDNGMQYSLGFGYNFTENWGAEIMGSLAPNLDFDNNIRGTNGDADITHARLNAIYHIGNGAFVPYLTAGVGGLWASADAGNNAAYTDDYNTFAVNAGVGMKLFLTEAVALRLEATDVHGFADSGTDNFAVNGGLTFQFGAAEGCLDEDNDGVCDPYDKCPGTPAGYRVDADGCPTTVSISLKVNFDYDKSDVKSQYHNEIGQVAEFMKQHPKSTTVVEGHTDSRGTDAYNQALSQRRADAVRNTLIRVFGVDADRLSAVGYGESRPVADNDTEAGRAQNRRVIGVVTGLEKD